MKPIFLLEPTDTILPTDYYRPLNRSADFDQHDEWLDESCYGGGPLDHLKWAPVWLVLGECWWERKYSEYIGFGQASRPFEAVRGELPNTHILSKEKWERRHPLWYAGYLKRKKLTEKLAFQVGKHKGQTIKQVLAWPEGEGYVRWYVENVAHAWENRVEEMFEGEKYKIYYKPSFKKYNAKTNQI